MAAGRSEHVSQLLTGDHGDLEVVFHHVEMRFHVRLRSGGVALKLTGDLQADRSFHQAREITNVAKMWNPPTESTGPHSHGGFDTPQ